MGGRREDRENHYWPGFADTFRHLLPSFGSGVVVLSLMVFMGSLACLTASAVAQQAYEENWSADGQTRMVAFRYPMNLVERINQSVVYYVTRSNEGDLLLRFHASNVRPEDRGLYGEYSISRDRVLHVADLYGDNREFTADVVRRIEAYASHKNVDELSAFGSSLIYPHLEDFAYVDEEYLIDLTYEGDYYCDPHAAAIYPTKRFNQIEFGRVFVRVNLIPILGGSGKYCPAWGYDQWHVQFINALVPDIYRLPNGGLLLADTDHPNLFISDHAKSVTDISFCIRTSDFVYAMVKAATLKKILETVERHYQRRRNRDIHGYFSYADSVRKNLDLMREVLSMLGEC